MITLKDLLKEISHTELSQLTDLNAKGELDEEVLFDAIDDAISFIESFIVIPPNPSALLKKLAVELTLMELRKRNKLGDEKQRKEQLSYIEDRLIKMAKRTIPVTDTQKPEKKSTFAFTHGKKSELTKGYR